MFSIKNSFANCSICPLLDAPSCIAETNCKDDITKIDVVFIAENPGKDEVEAKPPRPLVGRAGKKFRTYFQKHNLHKQKYVLINSVLCLTLNPDGTTGNPSNEVIDLCKENCYKFIETCNPKLIVAMGTAAMKIFGIAESGITKLRGQMYKWNERDIFLTLHPSFINRNPSYEDKFEEDLAKVSEILGSNGNVKTIKKSIIQTTKSGIFNYKIPSQFYTDKYRLVDIQYINKTRHVLYIFRDDQNNKVYHQENDDYICYQIQKDIEAKKIIPYEQLNQVKIKYGDKIILDPEITYEGDIRLTAKHAIDYYLHNQGEAKRIKSNIMFCDIEVDTKDERVFPNQKEAEYPICIITTKYHGHRLAYVVENQTEEIKDKPGTELKVFRTEKEMLQEFIKDFKKADPDFIVGWNFVAFDMEYIFNRLPKIGILQSSMSRFGEFYVDSSRYLCSLPGVVVLDQEHLYKMFTFTMKESYKLGFIAQEELGETKVELPIPINEMYWKMLNEFIDYALKDCELLEKLENKLKHVNLLNEIRFICNTSFQAGSSSFGQVDSLVVSFLKKKGLASKNGNPHIVKDPFPGAFVYEPIAGVYDYVTDFDFTSLYPSIIMTYNIGVNNFVMQTVDPTIGYDLAYGSVSNLPSEIEVIVDPTLKAQKVKIPGPKLFEMIKENNLIFTINGCFFKSHEDQVSVYNEILNNLLSSRKVYKKKMLEAKESKNDDDIALYNTRQLVYKVLANSLYGVIANNAFRFFDVSCAAAVTLGGQEALKTCIITADEYMKHLCYKKDLVFPVGLTKKEMYSDELPDRRTEFIVTGDTDSIFCYFGKFPIEKTDENIKTLCNEVQSFLNTKVIPGITNRHNINIENSKLDIKNELIISRGLFLAKKRYAIRVINQEGKKVDEIVSMGLETKRSDWPRKTKEFMNELLELLLKSEKISLKQILEYTARKEKEFIDLIKNGDKTVARPITYGKKLDQYKNLPQGVRAMETWNELMYRIHGTGSKAYLFHVAGLDTEKAPPKLLEKFQKFSLGGKKLEVLGVPDEEAKLPDYFVPNVKEMLKLSFKDRISNLLEPLLIVKETSGVLKI